MSNETTCGPITSELVADDPSFADLVAEFIDGLDARAKALQEAIDAQALDTVQALAHQLKGVGGGYGYPALSRTAAELEQRVQADDIERCKESLNELHSLLGRIEVGPASVG